jgi:pimeloyl-[acyl-carrier protein] methyl ester esterase
MPGPVHRLTVAQALGRAAVKAAPAGLWRATYLGTRRPGFAATASRYLREQFRGGRTGEYVLGERELATIDRPVLFIWGEQDERYQPIADARRKGECIPLSQFEVVPGGHEPWLDDPEPCNRLIIGFLAAEGQSKRRGPQVAGPSTAGS